MKKLNFNQSVALTFLELIGFISWIADGPRFITYIGFACAIFELSWLIVSSYRPPSRKDEDDN